MANKLVILSAPSGAGKTTLVHHLLGIDALKLEFSVSATSRPKRDHETDGVDYYFLSAEDFRNKIENDEFLEWEEVYENQYYGTLKTEVTRIWEKGRNVVFDVDVVGGFNIKKQYGDDALAVFVKPPSMKILEDRLTNRSSESYRNIQTRLAKAEEEMGYAHKFDKVVLNDSLRQAKEDIETLVADFLEVKLPEV